MKKHSNYNLVTLSGNKLQGGRRLASPSPDEQALEALFSASVSILNGDDNSHLARSSLGLNKEIYTKALCKLKNTTQV